MRKYYLILSLLITITLLSCTESASLKCDGENSIYYWRTTFSLNDAEREFLQKHSINKVYMRFFDVDVSYDRAYGESVVPEATILFNDSIPEGIEIVPTVYITVNAIKEMQLKEKEYARKIFNRVSAICRQNNIELRELQLDCDWTKRTRDYFFRLCKEVKQCMDSTQIVSSTIRLHQLTQTAPPVDKGVLMVYNTGNLMEMTTDNSIFSQKDIEPYLRDNRLADYPLTLDVAYPSYGWSLVFDHREDTYSFNRIMRRTDFSAFPELKEISPNLYEVTTSVNFLEYEDGWDYVYRGDRVRVERPTAEEILKIKRMIDAQLEGKDHNNILYHLDEEQLSHYTDNEISKIYSRN